MFELYVSPAAIMEKIVFFTCAYSPANKVSDGRAKEEGRYRWSRPTLKETNAMIVDDRDRRCKTVILVQYLSHCMQDVARS